MAANNTKPIAYPIDFYRILGVLIRAYDTSGFLLASPQFALRKQAINWRHRFHSFRSMLAREGFEDLAQKTYAFSATLDTTPQRTFRILIQDAFDAGIYNTKAPFKWPDPQTIASEGQQLFNLVTQASRTAREKRLAQTREMPQTQATLEPVAHPTPLIGEINDPADIAIRTIYGSPDAGGPAGATYTAPVATPENAETSDSDSNAGSTPAGGST